MPLKKELSEIAADTKQYNRTDFRQSIDFFKKYPSVATAFGLAMVLGGVASVLGYLKSQVPLVQWAFAVFLWTLAAIAFFNAAKAKRNNSD